MSQHVAIVGAGVIGIACAHYLRAAGHEVTLIDQGEVGSGASRHNCGHILPSHVLPLNEPVAILTGLKSLFNPSAPFRVKPTLDPATLRWFAAFVRRCNERWMLHAGAALKALLDSSRAEYDALLAPGGLQADWSRQGLLHVFKDQRGWDAFASTVELLEEEFGISARPLIGDMAANFEPALRPGLAGAFHYEGDAHLNPHLLVQGWAKRLKASGVRFLTGQAVHGVEAGGLHTAKGLVEADHVVLATGAWSGPLAASLGERIPIIPGKGYSLTLPRGEHHPRCAIVLPERNVALTPLSDGLRIGSMMEFVGFDASIPPRRMKQLRSSAASYLHGDMSTKGTPWFGWRPMTPDGLPIIDRLKGLPNTLIAAGHGMMGMMTAPATGKLIAEMVMERAPHIDATPYAASRF